jgi:adenylate cyclase
MTSVPTSAERATGARGKRPPTLGAELRAVGVDPAILSSEGPAAALREMRTRTLWNGEDPITIDEVARRADVDVELCRRARMLLGLPDPGSAAVCRPEEVAVLAALAFGLDRFGEDAMLSFARVMGVAMAMVAEGALSVFGRSLDESLERPGPGPVTPEDLHYLRAALAALRSFEAVPVVMDVVCRLQFDLATDRLGHTPGQEQNMAVGFVDLTRSTGLSARLSLREMSAALNFFEVESMREIVARGGQTVKFIGDEVMFVAPDLATGVDIAGAIIAAVAGDQRLVGAHGGVAYGPALGRDGDWFGTTVNVAARLSQRARVGEVLVAGDGAGDLPGARRRGRRSLRGLDTRVEVWRLVPPSPSSETPEPDESL